MPVHVQRIVLIRHDTSIANLDPGVYKRMPDHTIPLVNSRSEAMLRAIEVVGTLGLSTEETVAWCSPYVRCEQTQDAVLSGVFGAAASLVRRRESFLLREQEFGDWDSLTDAEAARELPRSFVKRKLLTDNLGKFYFRYPNGESRADVAQRMIAFIGKMHRSDYADHVVFLHGVTQRAFRMAWLNREVDWFEDEPNPKNASVMLLRRDAERRWIERYLPDGEEIACARVRRDRAE
ncbi:MAG: histidine phosphatase family protein [Polyangiales bacterium]